LQNASVTSGETDKLVLTAILLDKTLVSDFAKDLVSLSDDRLHYQQNLE
jgi:hypothetical protein